MTVIFGLSYRLRSIPSGTARLYGQDVARGATNRPRGGKMQDLQPTAASANSAMSGWAPTVTTEPP